MVKVVYNACYGGFGLSPQAVKRYAERKGLPYEERESNVWRDTPDIYVDGERFASWKLPRHDPDLVAVVEELGSSAAVRFADLAIADVSGIYRIEEYDGLESVVEPCDIDWVNPSA